MIRTVLMDPPWAMRSGGQVGLGAGYHYPLQKQPEIIETVTSWLNSVELAPEAHCYIWSINSFSMGGCRGILDAVDLCEAIGFRPITLIPWIKPNGSPTAYGVRHVEQCLFSVKHREGKIKEVAWSDGTVARHLISSKDYFMAPRGKHSKKPAPFYEYIERRSKGDYLELYARNTRKGWVSLGNEVNSDLSSQGVGYPRQIDMWGKSEKK